jgi:D-3-phosphoglycerate dehydrogenase
VSDARVAVCSRSFSRNETLRKELLERYPRTTFNDDGRSLAGAELAAFLRGHDKAIIALERVDAALLDAVPELRAIAKYGVGLDNIDTAALAARGVHLGWTPGVNRRSVAELVLAVAIDLLHGLSRGGREVRAGTWRQVIGRQLTGRTVGILGLGRIGGDVLRLLEPFGCTVLAHDLVERAEHRGRVRYVSLDELLAASEVLTIHLPLDASTRGLVDARRIGLLRRDAILINAARGGIVDEVAVRQALVEQRLAGAAFDVFATEPPQDRALLELESFIVTPHIGGSSIEAILAMGRAAIRGLDEPASPEDLAGAG